MHMSKYISTYTVVLGVVLFAASCSQEDVPRGNDSNRERIEFRASLPEITSRATQVTGSELDNFHVSAFTLGTSTDTPYFQYKPFTKNAVTARFLSSHPDCIWPNNNDVLRFVAISPSCEEMRLATQSDEEDFVLFYPEGEETSADEYELTNFRVAGDIAAQFDFITAIASGNLLEDVENSISLNFQHQLSRIKLNAWGASKSYDIEIAGVRLGGVGTEGVFTFAPQPGASDASMAGIWTAVDKSCVEYIYRTGDQIVVLDKSDNSPISAAKAVSIMGAKIGGADGYDNSAMIIPTDNQAWQYKDNAANGDNHSDGLYFSVLLRITNTTPYDNGKIEYPYTDEAGMEVIYMAVDKESPTNVLARLYMGDDETYYTDENLTSVYNLEENQAEVKAFGWAALPVEDKWQPGLVYTYTLNYTDGVGLRDPNDPKPGEPIINDKVIVNVEVAEWKDGNTSNFDVPRK